MKFLHAADIRQGLLTHTTNRVGDPPKNFKGEHLKLGLKLLKITETFAIKVESCQKSRRILDFFALLNFLGGTPCKISVNLIT